jgi:hypothetical protein
MDVQLCLVLMTIKRLGVKVTTAKFKGVKLKYGKSTQIELWIGF